MSSATSNAELDLDRQREYFDATRNQYDPRLISGPPRHVATEISLVIEKLDGLREDEWIVDFGAGTGRLTYPLVAAGYHVVAVDLSQVSLARIEEVTRDLPGRVLRTHDSLPPGERFVAVTGTDVLHHIDLATQIPRLGRSARPRWSAGVLRAERPQSLLVPLHHVLSRLEGRAADHSLPRAGHLTPPRRSSGFKEVRIQGLGLLPTALFNWSQSLDRANRWLGQLPVLRLFAYRIIVTAVR